MSVFRIHRAAVAVAVFAFVSTACNTTKSDSRNETVDSAARGSASTTPAAGASGAAPGAGVLAGPSVGSLTNVSMGDGKTAADFAWRDARGEHKLSNYRGRVVMINFWGTWCGPCRRELPSLVKIREDLGRDKFEIIGINIGEQEQNGSSVPEVVATFASENNIGYPLVIGDENLVKAYGGVNVVPTTFVVGKDGKIVERIEGSRDEADFRAMIGRAM